MSSAGESSLPQRRIPIATIMLFQVAALVARSFVEQNLVQSGYDREFANKSSAIAGFLVLALLLLPLRGTIRAVAGRQFRRPCSWSRLVLLSSLLGVVLWLAQMLTLLLTAPLAWPPPGTFRAPTLPVYTFSCERPLLLLVAVPVMALMTPMIEEVINRGLLLQALLARGQWFAIMASAMLFAILHPPATMPFAWVFGIVAAVQMLHFKTLWAPIISHGTNNLLVVTSQRCVSGSWAPGHIEAGLLSPLALIVALLVACAALTWWLAARVNAGTVPVPDRPGKP